MLNRRFLRIKIMQALYAYFRDEKANMEVAEKNLNTTIDKTYELFLYLVSFLSNLHFTARIAAAAPSRGLGLNRWGGTSRASINGENNMSPTNRG